VRRPELHRKLNKISHLRNSGVAGVTRGHDRPGIESHRDLSLSDMNHHAQGLAGIARAVSASILHSPLQPLPIVYVSLQSINYTVRRLRWRYWSAMTAATITPPLMIS
jgi:hypothetical protein